MYQPPDWSLGDKYLRENVPELAPLVEKYSPCPLKPKAKELYFSTLLSGIVAQQLPPDVSQRIMKALSEMVGNPIEPEGIIDLEVDKLHAIGITSQKIDYMKDFGRACLNGKVTMDKFHEMTDSEITKQLLNIRGLGQWTIEMFLLLCLCRTDVVPSADFIFKKELQKLLHLEEVPKRGKINKLTETWRPWRSLAVWYLWAEASEKC